MFNSISNNFGAGSIQFKDVQEVNYVVLNAKFTCDPQGNAYKAANVLEITIPRLSINRSTETGVIVRFIDRKESYGQTNVYDGGTIAKSWIKDANTLCVEKLSIFDDQTELIVYIQTLYCQLGLGANASKARAKSIKCTSEDNYLKLSTSDTFCVIFKKWAFYHMMYRNCASSMEKADWDAFFENFPDDINVDIPVIGASNSEHPKLGSVTESHLEDGYFSLPASERSAGFSNTANYIFSFAYLVREPGPEFEGRLHYENEQLQINKNYAFSDVHLDLIPVPAVAALSGNMGIYSAGPMTFPAKDFPEEIPTFNAFFLATHQHSNGLTVQLLEVKVSKSDNGTGITVGDLSGDKNLSFKLFDTAIAMAI